MIRNQKPARCKINEPFLLPKEFHPEKFIRDFF
jgi:hypothetical protein